MSDDRTDPQPQGNEPASASPAPEWDAARQQWVANGHGWDQAAQQWVPLAPPTPPAASWGPPTQPSQPAQPSSPWAQYPGQTTPPAWAGQGAPGATPAKKGLGTGAIIGIIVGGVAVIAVIAVIASVLLIPRGQNTAENAATIVKDYLTAVSESDAEAALALLDSPPDDTGLLTDDVLRASNEAAPLADIQASTPQGVSSGDYYIDVPVSYTIGGTPVDTVITVTDIDDDGDWKVRLGTVQLYVSSALSGLDLTINGQTVESDTIDVFPGTYELATTTPNYVLSGNTTATLGDPNDYSGGFDDVRASLDEEGVTTFRTAVTDAVTACIASTTLAAGCGIDIPETLGDGTKVIEGTVKRSLSAEAQAKLANLQPEQIYSDPLQVPGPYIGSVEVTADCESNGQRYTGCTFLFLPSLSSPLVDFTTDPVTVRWD